MLDIFNQDPFSVVSMTARINNIPFVPGQLGALGVFSEDGISTLTAIIERDGLTLGLVAPTPRGGPGETAPHTGRNMLSVVVPHYQRDDAVYADEVQGVRAFGTDADASGTLATIEQLVERKMRKHTIAFDATLEHQRVGALKGLVVDKNGNTILDLSAAFGGVSIPAAMDWTLGTSTVELRQLGFDVIDAVETALDGLPYGGITALTGKSFWRKLIAHKAVKETYLNWIAAAELRGVPSESFEFAGIDWRRYRTGTQAQNALSTPAPFVPDNGALIVIHGVPDLYKTFFSPADYIETVNTIGLPRYAKQYPMKNDKGVNMEMQTNAISLCTRPQALLSLTTSN